jgi:carboxyl-terminal processing protease
MMQNVFNFILQNHVEEIDPQVLFEGTMNGMFGALDDPYSVFMTESDMEGYGRYNPGKFWRRRA